jgi:TPP-dependent pyruvate/acetoin dehydrogenase alpha subunit
VRVSQTSFFFNDTTSIHAAHHIKDTTGIFRDGKNDGFEWESATARTQTPKSLIPKELLVQDRLLSIYRQILQLVELDSCLSSCQRQGRISFYMTSHGEEAIHFGAASALSLQDPVFAQYREAGVLLHRNFSLQQFVDQCFSNKDDLGRGRQMPVHCKYE